MLQAVMVSITPKTMIRTDVLCCGGGCSLSSLPIFGGRRVPAGSTNTTRQNNQLEREIMMGGGVRRWWLRIIRRWYPLSSRRHKSTNIIFICTSSFRRRNRQSPYFPHKKSIHRICSNLTSLSYELNTPLLSTSLQIDETLLLFLLVLHLTRVSIGSIICWIGTKLERPHSILINHLDNEIRLIYQKSQL